MPDHQARKVNDLVFMATIHHRRQAFVGCARRTIERCRVSPQGTDSVRDRLPIDCRRRMTPTDTNAGVGLVIVHPHRFEDEEVTVIQQSAEVYKASLKKGRDSRFRNDVLLSYRCTCALTGYSLNTTKENMVEAAHIHQHAVSGNDDPRNGLALTPDAHWMFDRGLWTAEPCGDEFIVIIAKGHFKESSPYGRTLCNHHEKPLFFPEDTILRPDPKHFAWHRKHRFVG